MIVTFMFVPRESWLYVGAFDIGRSRGSEVGVHHLDVMIAVEFVHVDRRFPELPGVVDRRRTCFGESRMLRQRCGVRFVANDPTVAREWQNLEGMTGHQARNIH
jgi:hypothetical protein